MHIMSSTRLPAYYTILQDLEEKNKGEKAMNISIGVGSLLTSHFVTLIASPFFSLSFTIWL